MIWVHTILCMIWAGIKAANGYQKSSPSYKLNSLNFDFEKLSVETLWDHINITEHILYVFRGSYSESYAKKIWMEHMWNNENHDPLWISEISFTWKLFEGFSYMTSPQSDEFLLCDRDRWYCPVSWFIDKQRRIKSPMDMIWCCLTRQLSTISFTIL